MLNIEALKTDDLGLIPAIVQDADTGQVLMMAYMNAESLRITIQEGYTCFYSRSRQTLWRKGETSGNRQRVVSITADCDADTLLIKVRPLGPACHTGNASCFFQPIVPPEEEPPFSIQGLYEMLCGRKSAPKEGSYTSYLFEKGLDKILKKVGEENAEVLIAAKGGDVEETVFELADLAYHALVLMVQMGITPAQLKQELASRHVGDNKVKQERLQ